MRIASARVTVSSDGPPETRLVHTIQLDGEWWLVGKWHPDASGSKDAPAILIRAAGHGLLTTEDPDRDFVLCDVVPASVLDGDPEDGYEIRTLEPPEPGLPDDHRNMVAFSRGPTSGGTFGKCDSVLKTNVPEVTFFAFSRQAHAAGCSMSELLRDLVCLSVHGEAFGEITATDRKILLGSALPEETKPAWYKTAIKKRAPSPK